jgi:hypothetical protein
MRGDFSRDTFNSAKHFSRVLMQQGRVQLDADFNEQAAILLYHMRALTSDVIGPHAGPWQNGGFGIVDFTKLSREEQARLKESGLEPEGNDFLIGFGRYYVDGIMVENDDYVLYTGQDDLPQPDPLTGGAMLIYLDVWERYITAIEDDSIREVALGGPDTAGRVKVIWQVRAVPLKQGETADDYTATWQEITQPLTAGQRGRLRARTPDDQVAADPCVIPPDSRYRGAENQLYRVEIHRGSDAGQPTFKWSRDNGSVVFPISKITADVQANTTSVWVAHLGRDQRLSLAEGDWVEVVHDGDVLLGQPSPLGRVIGIDRDDMVVTLQGALNVGVEPDRLLIRPLLRRWDQRNGDEQLGTLPVPDSNRWVELEDGIQIQFVTGEYRSGDYWLIPARTATGDIEWPRQRDASDQPMPRALLPRTTARHYAPLAVVMIASGRINYDEGRDLRCLFAPLPCVPSYGYGYGFAGEAIGPNF